MNFESCIPTNISDDLRRLVGCKLMSIKRYSWWPPEDVVSDYGVAPKDVFSLTAGPAAIEMETGIVLGIASDPSLNSVVVWVEKDISGNYLRDEPLDRDEELHEISSVDPIYSNSFWHRLAGCRVVEIKVLKRVSESIRVSQRPCQVGLSFLLDSGDVFLAAHGLHDDSDDFSIIPESLILPSLQEGLKETLL